MSTGELPAVRTGLGLMTFPPQVSSVRNARHYVEAALARTALQPLADDAGLLVSELAANAVLHARTDFDVVVYETQDGVRVSVRDRSLTLPVLIAPSATAMSGRGLTLVQTLASRWGVGTGAETGKSVWFELVLADALLAEGPGLGGHSTVVPDVSVEELLAAWSEADEAPVALPTHDVGAGPSVVRRARRGGEPGPFDGDRVEVVLPALGAVELLAAKEQMDDVLRELQLVMLDQRDDASATRDDVRIARRLDQTARAFDDVRRQVRHQVSRAVAVGRRRVELRLLLQPGSAALADEYRSAVEEAETIGLQGGLLSVAGSLREHRAIRRAYLDEVIAADGIEPVL